MLQVLRHISSGLTKDQIVLRPLKDADVHSLVVITNDRRKQSEIGAFFLTELKKTLEKAQDVIIKNNG